MRTAPALLLTLGLMGTFFCMLWLCVAALDAAFAAVGV